MSFIYFVDTLLNTLFTIYDFMIRVNELKKSYGDRSLFTDISFQLTKKERCSLVGRNGSGKSTLLRILSGEETSDCGTIAIPKNYQFGYLSQQITFSQNTLREEAALALPLEERATPYRVETILSGLGFRKEDFEKNPRHFSGGYQLRIQLAKTLVKEPDCLLLDEPTNYLDIVSIHWLQGFLNDWKNELIFISHDRSFLDSIATHTMGLHRGKLYRVKGSSKEYYNFLVQEEQVHEKRRLKVEKQKEQATQFIRRFGAKATKAKQAKSRMKSIARLPSLEQLTEIEGLSFRFNTVPFRGKKMMHAENLQFKFPDMENPLIDQFSLEIESGDRFAIIGKNGRGKSTLLRLLARQLTPLNGTVTYAENLAIGYFGQTAIQMLDPCLSVEEAIQQANIALSFEEVKNICGMMMFSGQQTEKKIAVLSGGEKSRVLLGKILASECNCLLLDEPSNHLDLESVEALLEALEAFSGSIVIVSHDEEILNRIPNKLIVCHQARQHVFYGDYAQFLEKIGWEKAVGGKGKKSRTKSEERQRSAERVQERSRVLKPIKKQIEKLEKNLAADELEISTFQKQLQEAVASNDKRKLSQLLQSIGEKQKQIEGSYDQLELLYQKLEQENAMQKNY